jgi:hypothetical protein
VVSSKEVDRKIAREQHWKRFNLLRVVVWLITIPVAFFLGWVYSVAFVAVCSLYANVASDWAAFRADDNPQLVRMERKLDEILEKLREVA